MITLCICLSANAQVIFIAHRGASWDAPENTLASVNMAWAMDVEVVEIDIHLSKNNKIMVIHDDNTIRTTGEDYDVINTNSKVLRKLDAGSFKGEQFKGEKIPFLEEVIGTIPAGKKLVVELKSRDNVLPGLKKIMKNNKKASQLIFICFDKETIIKIKEAFPENHCYWLCSNRDFMLANIHSVAQAGLDGVGFRFSIIDEHVMELVQKLDLELFTYTVNEPDEARRLINLGVRQIATDRPEWLKNQIEKSQ